MFIQSAYAQTAGTAADAGGVAGFLSLAPLLLVFIVFYVLMIRPQQRRMKALQASIEAVRKGDQVVTAGGVVGKVTRVEERFVELEIAPSTRIRVVKATLAEITSSTAKPAND